MAGSWIPELTLPWLRPIRANTVPGSRSTEKRQQEAETVKAVGRLGMVKSQMDAGVQSPRQRGEQQKSVQAGQSDPAQRRQQSAQAER